MNGHEQELAAILLNVSMGWTCTEEADTVNGWNYLHVFPFRTSEKSMSPATADHWPLGVFTSIDAGLGVSFEVLAELKLTTIQLSAPNRSGGRRTQWLR